MAKHHRIGGAEKKPPRISYMHDTTPVHQHHLTVPEQMTIEEEDGLLNANAIYLTPSVHIVDFNDDMHTPDIDAYPRRVRRKPPRPPGSPIAMPVTDLSATGGKRMSLLWLCLVSSTD
jgi:hypothetical protein